MYFKRYYIWVTGRIRTSIFLKKKRILGLKSKQPYDLCDYNIRLRVVYMQSIGAKLLVRKLER